MMSSISLSTSGGNFNKPVLHQLNISYKCLPWAINKGTKYEDCLKLKLALFKTLETITGKNSRLLDIMLKTKPATNTFHQKATITPPLSQNNSAITHHVPDDKTSCIIQFRWTTKFSKIRKSFWKITFWHIGLRLRCEQYHDRNKYSIYFLFFIQTLFY